VRGVGERFLLVVGTISVHELNDKQPIFPYFILNLSLFSLLVGLSYQGFSTKGS
jgi:hypothetical protein